MFNKTAIATVMMLAAFPCMVNAQTTVEAQEVLKQTVANIKAKGVAKAAEEMTAGTDPSKCKDKPGVGGFIASADSKMLGNCKNPKMVGMEFPADFADVDGTPIVKQVIGPMQSGKVKWEAKYKFAQAGTKKIVPQHAFCEKIDANIVACATAILSE